MDSGMNPDEGNDGNDICVPVDSISIEGHAPQEGDTVDFAIEARVTRVEGDMAYVTPEKVNGEEVGEDKDEEGNSDNDENAEPTFSQSGDYVG